MKKEEKELITKQDIKELERQIKEQKAPIYFETPFGRFAFVLTEQGKLKVANQGFIPIQIKDLWEWIKDCKTYQEQREIVERKQKELADFHKTAFTIKDLFSGEIKNIKE